MHLRELFEMQKILEKEFDDRNLKPKESIHRNSWNILSIILELAEVAEELEKPWRQNKPPADREHLVEELSDALHFWLTLCIDLNYTAEDLERAYTKKWEENFKRIKAGR